MGGFSAGANVNIYSATGTLVGTAATDATGSAQVNIGSFTGAFITGVSGGPNVTVYNEGTGAREPFSASNILLEMSPSVPTSGKVGVTPLTNAAAAVLILNPAKPALNIASTSNAATAIANVNTTVQNAVGLTGIDITAAPAPLNSPTSTIASTDPNTVVYSAYLASMAIASPATSLVQAAANLSSDAQSNGGTMTNSVALLRVTATKLSSVISSSVAASSVTTAVTATTSTVQSNVTASTGAKPAGSTGGSSVPQPLSPACAAAKAAGVATTGGVGGAIVNPLTCT